MSISLSRRRLADNAFQPHIITRFGGLNEDQNPNALGPAELVESMNDAPYDNSHGTRPGWAFESLDYDDKIATSGSDNDVQGIFNWSTRNDFDRDNLLVIAGGNLYTDDTTTVTKGAAVISAGLTNRWTFAAHRNLVYFAGGASGDTFNTWDGAGNIIPVDVQDISATTLEPKYVLAKWGFVFIAGMDPATPDATNNKMVVRYPDLGRDFTTTAAWRPENTIGAEPSPGSIGGLADYGDEFITGLADYQDNDGDWLLILTSRRIAAVRLGPTGQFAYNDSVPNGCVHQNAYVTLGVDAGDAIYMSERGIHSLRSSQDFGGKEDTFLSWKIRTTFQSINRAELKNVVGGYDPEEGLVVFAFATGSSTTNDTMVCLDVKGQTRITAENARWHKWRLGVDAGFSARVNALTVARAADGKPRLYAGTASDTGIADGGHIGFMNRTTYSDWGTAYDVAWRTADYGFDNPVIRKQLGDAHIDILGAGDHVPTTQVVFDYGMKPGVIRSLSLPPSDAGVWDTALWGQAQWGGGTGNTIRRKLYAVGSGFTVSRRFSIGAVANAPFFIQSVTQEIEASGETYGG